MYFSLKAEHIQSRNVTVWSSWHPLALPARLPASGSGQLKETGEGCISLKAASGRAGHATLLLLRIYAV